MAIAVGAILIFPAIRWVQKLSLKPLLKPYLTAQIPDFRAIGFYQQIPNRAGADWVPVSGLRSTPAFNGKLQIPEQQTSLQDFIRINTAFMEQTPKLLFAANMPDIPNSFDNINGINQSAAALAITARFYHIRLEYDIAQNDLSEAMGDLKIIHQTLIELAKFPYVFANYYFLQSIAHETTAIGRVLNCVDVPSAQLTEIAAMLRQSGQLLPESFKGGISGQAYYILFAPMAERKQAIGCLIYPRGVIEPGMILPVRNNYSLQKLWQRERFFIKYFSFARSGLFDFQSRFNDNKAWRVYQNDLKSRSGMEYWKNDVDIYQLYLDNINGLAKIRLAQIATAVRMFELQNHRTPAGIAELISQKLISQDQSVDPFTQKTIDYARGTFPVLQEIRYFGNRRQDHFEDCPTIRLICMAQAQTLQYFVVNKIKHPQIIGDSNKIYKNSKALGDDDHYVAKVPDFSKIEQNSTLQPCRPGVKD